MSCGSPHLDIFEDSTIAGGGLEIERFKTKLREIWSRILEQTYTDSDGMSKEEYIEANSLRFADEPQEESEIDNLMAMLDDLLDPREELESVQSESKAPSYHGSHLSSNNEKGKIGATTYKVKHSSTSTPSDSRSAVKGGSYDKPSGGKIATRKDARVIRSFAPVAEQMKDELIALKLRQNIGRRRELFRL